MNTLLWVLVGLAAYSAAALFLSQRGLLPSSVRIQGPFTTVHTKRGRDFIDWIATPKRFWRAWTNLGVGATLVVMAGMFLFLLVQGIAIARNPPPPSSVNQPQNFLVIPGVNDFLPLAVAPEIVFGLLVGLVVHEGGHGILCRVEDIDIESMGVFLFTVIPLGAFVEPDEESQRNASRGGRTRMFAAGVTNNFFVTFVAFVLLFGPIIGSIGVAMTATGLVLFFYALAQTGDLFVAQTLLFTFLVSVEMVRIQLIRRRYHQPITSNRWLLVAIAVSFLLQLGVLYTPIADFFDVLPVTATGWLWIGVAFAGFVVVSLVVESVADRLVDVARRP